MTEDQRRENFAKLAAEIDAAGGIDTVMEMKLRDAYGVSKFGWRVALAIETDYLPRVGLDILQPAKNPLPRGERLQRDQYAAVVLYDVDSPVGKVVSYVQNPTPNRVKNLRRAVATDAIEKLKRVRSILGDE